jgi:hypothetical protein
MPFQIDRSILQLNHEHPSWDARQAREVSARSPFDRAKSEAFQKLQNITLLLSSLNNQQLKPVIHENYRFLP